MDLITPDWPAPANVKSAQTTRHGGVSVGRYCCLNLGGHVGDSALAVSKNRALLRAALSLPSEPLWLNQVHGHHILHADDDANADSTHSGRQDDGCVTTLAGRVCVIMTADCLPVLLCDRSGSCVAAAHAGWRGLAAGVLERTFAAMRVPGHSVMAWLGPAIGLRAFEVGDEVRARFVAHDAAAAAAFHHNARGRWQCDLYLLARQRLLTLGIKAIYGGEFCTFDDANRFYSYRRDGETGRMATLVWRK